MPEGPILVMDRNEQNRELLDQFLRKEGHEVVLASSLEDLDAILDRLEKIGLALVDIGGFERSIWDRCERLRDMKIPFLVISPRQIAAVREEGYARGAQGFLVKPLAQRELLAIINTLLEDENEQGTDTP